MGRRAPRIARNIAADDPSSHWGATTFLRWQPDNRVGPGGWDGGYGDKEGYADDGYDDGYDGYGYGHGRHGRDDGPGAASYGNGNEYGGNEREGEEYEEDDGVLAGATAKAARAAAAAGLTALHFRGTALPYDHRGRGGWSAADDRNVERSWGYLAKEEETGGAGGAWGASVKYIRDRDRPAHIRERIERDEFRLKEGQQRDRDGGGEVGRRGGYPGAGGGAGGYGGHGRGGSGFGRGRGGYHGAGFRPRAPERQGGPSGAAAAAAAYAAAAGSTPGGGRWAGVAKRKRTESEAEEEDEEAELEEAEKKVEEEKEDNKKFVYRKSALHSRSCRPLTPRHALLRPCAAHVRSAPLYEAELIPHAPAQRLRLPTPPAAAAETGGLSLRPRAPRPVTDFNEEELEDEEGCVKVRPASSAAFCHHPCFPFTDYP